MTCVHVLSDSRPMYRPFGYGRGHTPTRASRSRLGLGGNKAGDKKKPKKPVRKKPAWDVSEKVLHV